MNNEAATGNLRTARQLAGAYRAQAQERRRAGDLREARALLQRAIALAQQGGDEIGKAMNISLLGEIEAQVGDLSRAVARFQEAVSIFEVAGHLHDAGITYHQWAKAYYVDARMEEAGEYFIQSARCFHEEGDDATLAAVANSFQTCLSALDRMSAGMMAGKWFQAGLPVFDGIGQGIMDMLVAMSEQEKGGEDGETAPGSDRH